MTEDEVKQKIIDRIGILADEADAFQLSSLTTTLGLVIRLDKNKPFTTEDASALSVGALSGLMFGAATATPQKEEQNG